MRPSGDPCQRAGINSPDLNLRRRCGAGGAGARAGPRGDHPGGVRRRQLHQRRVPPDRPPPRRRRRVAVHTAGAAVMAVESAVAGPLPAS